MCAFQGFITYLMAGVAECFSYFGYNLGLSDEFVKDNTDRLDIGISISLFMKFYVGTCCILYFLSYSLNNKK